MTHPQRAPSFPSSLLYCKLHCNEFIYLSLTG
jgi:hypothetical protein